MNPQRMLLTRRSAGASRDGQFNRLAEVLYKRDKRHKNMEEKNLRTGLDNATERCYTLNLDK